ncbi:MAG: dockerin type I repeat-containing protein [Ruminococcus sp.]|nr:dockerin type I repeat-containing protein [Ruminococcus sp.]
MYLNELIGDPVVYRSGVAGDVNADGAFNIADVVALQKWLLAVPDTHLANWKAADLCEDERMDAIDLCIMKRNLLQS